MYETTANYELSLGSDEFSAAAEILGAVSVIDSVIKYGGALVLEIERLFVTSW